MRTLLAGEFETATDWDADYYVKFEVQNASGTWIDVGAALGRHWVVNVRWSETIDQPISRLTVTLVPIVNGTSLSPLMATSSLNVKDDSTYAPLLEFARLVRLNVATMPMGVALDESAYRPVFDGRIDEVDEADAPEGQRPITLQCSDLGAWLMDIEIESTTDRQYGTDAAPGTPLEDVLQAIIDDNIPSGEPAVTLYKQSTSTLAVTPKYTQQQDKLLPPLINIVLDTTGEDLRYRYDASHVSRLTWFNPDRARTTVDGTFDVNGYAVQSLKRSLDDVRNAGRIPSPETANAYVENTETTVTAASVADYRRHFMQLPASSQLTTDAQAQTVIDAAVNDLAGAPIDMRVLFPFLWFVQLFDRYTFPANGRQFSDDQTLGVVGFEHSIESGKGRTILSGTGRVVGAYAAWRKRIALGGPGANAPSVTVIPNGSDDSGMTVTLEATHGLNATGTPRVSYRTSDDTGVMGDWSDWAASPLSVHLDYLAKNSVVVQGRALQSDGQIGLGAQITLRGKLEPIDVGTGRVKRAVPLDDGSYAVKSSAFDGTVIDNGVAESGGKAVNLLFAKPLASDPDDLGSVPDQVGGRAAIASAYLDPVNRPVALRDPAGFDVGANDINVGQFRARTGLDAGGVVQLGVPLAHAAANIDAISTADGKILTTIPLSGTTGTPVHTQHSVGVLTDGATVQDGAARARAGLDATTGAVTVDVPRGRAAANIPALDATTGRVIRAEPLDDGSYAVKSSAFDGTVIDNGVAESGGKAVNLLFAKPLASDPDTLGSVPDEPGGRSAVASSLLDGSNRIVAIYDPAGAVVGANDINVGSGSALAGLTAAGDVKRGVPLTYAVENVPAINGTSGLVDPDQPMHGIPFAPARHIDQKIVASGAGSVAFTVGFQNPPKMVGMPQVIAGPATTGLTFDIRATDTTATTFVPRAVYSSGGSSTSETNDFAATLGGTTNPSGIAIATDGGAAYSALTNANANLTTYHVLHDVDLSACADATRCTVNVYKYDGAAYTLVGSANYYGGTVLTGADVSFSAALGSGYTIRVVTNYAFALGSSTTGTITAKVVDYQQIGAPTDTFMASGGDQGVLFQAMENV